MDVSQTARDFISTHFPGIGVPSCAVKALSDMLNAPRQPMTEDEMLQRARRAATSASKYKVEYDGTNDDASIVLAALAALRDLDKPLVDPVVLACREIVADKHEGGGFAAYRISVKRGDHDDSRDTKIAIAAYQAARS